MKKQIIIICLILGIQLGTKAQFNVTIPDANFATYLQTNFPSVISGNQLDTNLLASTYINGYGMDVSNLNISDLTGIQYFHNLYWLNCSNNNLSFIPSFTSTLPYYYMTYLYCDHNNLTSLPLGLDSLFQLTCSYNQLTSLPMLPDYMDTLNVSNNNIHCFPPLPNSAYYIDISSNPATCLPNHTIYMDANAQALPLCAVGDTVNNPYGCAAYEEIAGWTYKDNNSNCIYDAGDDGMGYINLKLFDNTGTYVSQTNSYSNGMYSFLVPAGTYTVRLDTAGVPYHTVCAHPGIDTTFAFSSVAQNVNFSVACNGFDVGCQYIFPHGQVFPGTNHHTEIYAGDMGQWYNFSCANGVGGTVTITYSGPVTYVGPSYWAAIPSVSGNVLTYTVANFGSIFNWGNFGIELHTDTTATMGDQVCLSVVVTPSSSGDVNPSNNTYNLCYNVFNSYDPNLKEVYPENVPALYDDYLTYTIHFQNTGSAAAQNIKVVDTLSNLLDVATFKEINHSHADVISFNGNVATFKFPNINLIDSTTNDTASIGWIQYKIKPIAGLGAGTFIHNRASIYFDYNAPVMTPTATTVFGNVGVSESSKDNTISVYPNPTSGVFRIDAGSNKIKEIKITDILGRTVMVSTINMASHTIDLSKETKGIYFIQITDEKNNKINRKVIKN